MDCDATEVDATALDKILTNKVTMMDDSYYLDGDWFDTEDHFDGVVDNECEYNQNNEVSTSSTLNTSVQVYGDSTQTNTNGFSNLYFEKSKEALKNCCSGVLKQTK